MGYTRCGAWPTRWERPGPLGPFGPVQNRRPQQMKEATGSVLQRFLAEDGGSAAGLAWLRGAWERCAVASARRLEKRQMARGRAEWRALGSYCGKKREWASPSDWQWEEKTHAAAAACTAHGGWEAGCTHRSGSWCSQDASLVVGVITIGTTPRRMRARPATDRCFRQRLRLTSGPRHFFIYLDFWMPTLWYSNWWSSWCPNFAKVFIGIAGKTRNNFPFWHYFKFPKDRKL
jgi:hypothetical protein